MKTTRFGIGTTIIAGLAMISTTVIGCAGDPSTPNKNNFRAGIEAYYERARPCFVVPGVYPNSRPVPVPAQRYPNFLSEIGLLTEAVEVESPFGGPMQEWELTAAGEAAVDSVREPKSYDSGATTFCFAAKYAVVEVVDYTPPRPDFVGLLSWVTHKYEVTGATEWADTARMTAQKYADARKTPFHGDRQRALRDLRALNEPQTIRLQMVQTEYGWVDPRMQDLD